MPAFSGMTSNPLDHHRDALADADAHGAEGVTAAAAVELFGGGEGQAGAGHAEGGAEGDGAAVRVDVLGVVGEAELAEHRQSLGSESFVDLDNVHIPDA